MLQSLNKRIIFGGHFSPLEIGNKNKKSEGKKMPKICSHVTVGCAANGGKCEPVAKHPKCDHVGLLKVDCAKSSGPFILK